MIKGLSQIDWLSAAVNLEEKKSKTYTDKWNAIRIKYNENY